MKILIDSADVEKIKEISKYREITGITTNPTILSKVEGDIKNILKELLGTSSDYVFIEPSFRCDYGFNIHIHGFSFINYKQEYYENFLEKHFI